MTKPLHLLKPDLKTLSAGNTIFHRIRAAIQARRAKRTKFGRKTLSGSGLSETLELEFGTTTIKVTNSVSPTYMMATTTGIQFVITELHTYMQCLACEPNSAPPGSHQALDGIGVVCPEDSDDDPETCAYVDQANDIMKSKDSV